ncbi:hypothetical protein SAMN05216462_3023 [Xylanibacter ruminicola]|uniref:Uncharacterized protein n=1 Tax=Xylanibacter ruminicola TaxID=839 RepID=A0A1H4EX03_XYLRU|nr:hypothetical protein [Xylanibacter ruminicola]SEA89489.1 hypothetical protein SAMN05216462_3023 [Xylanibacter ruminicola]
MKRFAIKLALLTLMLPVSTYAQESGYYRLKNRDTERYLSIVDYHVDKSNIDRTTELYIYALRTIKGFDKIANDPGSVLYIEKTSNGYILKGQGFDTYSGTGIYLNLTEKNGGYTIWGTATKSGVTATKYLRDADDEWYAGVGYITTDSNKSTHWVWDLIPVSDAEGAYLGLKGDVNANGKYYTTFYASFPIRVGSGMKAYKITETNEGAAKLVNIGSEVPAQTGVVIECAGADASANKVTPITSTSADASGNQLAGLYFCNITLDENDKENPSDLNWNATSFNKENMRLLGANSDGKLVFTSQTDTRYLPANKAYLPVSSSTAANLLVLGESDYTGIRNVNANKKADDTIYTLTGSRANSKTLRPGIYIQNGQKVVIK